MTEYANDTPEIIDESVRWAAEKLRTMRPEPPWWRPLARRRWRKEVAHWTAVSRSATSRTINLMLRRVFDHDYIKGLAAKANPMLDSLKVKP
jgi:hypothetical protein